jgi:SAM-dependent methyltransferase
MTKLTCIASILRKSFNLKIHLLKNKHNRIVAFDLPSMGEVQFFESVFRVYAEKNPEDLMLIIHHSDSILEFNQYFPDICHRFIHVDNKVIRSLLYPEIDLFLTTEQYSYGLDSVYSVVLFHGQPSKGLTFTKEIMASFDALFLYGSLQKDAFNNFLSDWGLDFSEQLDLFDIGYPKSDNLLNGFYDSEAELKRLNIDLGKKTLLYAPAFNEGASLREWGLEIIQILANLEQYNILVKLPIDCWQPTTNIYATGGVDWFQAIRNLEQHYPNLRLIGDYQIDSLLACSDILITCISSVSFEFLALNKPVIFIDTPTYFNSYLKRRFPRLDTSDWVNRTTVNGGKEFGLVVQNIKELPNAIRDVLGNYQKYPLQQDRLKGYLLYNRGHATQAAVNQIMDILAKGKKSRRSFLNGLFIMYCWKTLLKPLKYVVRFFVTPRVLLKMVFSAINRCFQAFGYRVEKSGQGYLDPEKIVLEARKAKLTICEYLEKKEEDVRKQGRRDRIICELEEKLELVSCKVILEIGAGTGMYMEKIIPLADPLRYEVYEIHRGWVNYLKSAFDGNYNCQFLFHSADGQTLAQTPADLCNLVHAHGVFIYLSFLHTFSYFTEIARVLAPNGYLVFDCYTESCFEQKNVQSWLRSPWRFPVIIPEQLLLGFAYSVDLRLQDRFQEVHGESHVEYFIFKKNG